METLSDKIKNWSGRLVLKPKDVKEFIRQLKEELNVRHAIVPVEIIDKLAGEKLI